jgi:pilus assembly protein Flp/PilA
MNQVASLYVTKIITLWKTTMKLLVQKAQMFMGKLIKGEEGVTAIEYALIAALIAVVIIAGATALGLSLNDIFTRIATLIGATPVP